MKKLIESLKKANEHLHCEWYTKVVSVLEKREFPNLESGRKYNVVWQPNGVKVVSVIPFFDEKMNCWNTKDTQTVAIIDF